MIFNWHFQNWSLHLAKTLANREKRSYKRVYSRQLTYQLTNSNCYCSAAYAIQSIQSKLSQSIRQPNKSKINQSLSVQTQNKRTHSNTNTHTAPWPAPNIFNNAPPPHQLHTYTQKLHKTNTHTQHTHVSFLLVRSSNCVLFRNQL